MKALMTVRSLVTLAVGIWIGLCGVTQAQAESAPAIRAHCGSSIQSSSPSADAALTTMLSLQHVRHGLSQAAATLSNPTYCVSGLALSRNVYQYVQYYFQIDVHSGNEEKPAYQFRFLFQNASVQAYHNYQGQPWTGLPPARVDEILNGLVRSAHFTPIATSENGGASTDPLTLAKQSKTFAASRANVDDSSISILQLPAESQSGKTVHLVTWLSQPPANPYAGFSQTMGVLIAVDADGTVSLAENVFPTTSILFPMTQSLTETMASLPGRDDWASWLSQMADVKSN